MTDWDHDFILDAKVEAMGVAVGPLYVCLALSAGQLVSQMGELPGLGYRIISISALRPGRQGPLRGDLAPVPSREGGGLGPLDYLYDRGPREGAF
jgi:hypothetical protein